MPHDRRYAGIGSRRTPEPVLRIMRTIGQMRAEAGWILRSGRAAGADTAFESGARMAATLAPRLELYTPDGQYGISAAHLAVAQSLHPAWERCSDLARRAHARNAAIILGPTLIEHVEEVLFWTPNAALVGGTAMGLRIAIAHHIPTRFISPTADWHTFV